MRPISVQGLLIAGLGGVLVLGCESAEVRHRYTDDPLVMMHKPVAGSLENSGPSQVVWTEPSGPPLPALAVTMAPPPFNGSLLETPPAARSFIPGTLTSRSKFSETDFGPPRRRQVPETFGHAPDYTWLQGVLDKQDQGHPVLRFGYPAAEEKWGGRVSLAEDARLTPFQDGDLVLVEGELVSDRAPREGDKLFSQYRIRAAWLVQRRGLFPISQEGVAARR